MSDLYATDWRYEPEPCKYGKGAHHLITSATPYGRRFELAEIDLDSDDEFSPRMSEEEAAKIGRIMAAAPDLLAACKTVVAPLPSGARVQRVSDEIDAMLRAAIAKAEPQG